MTSTRRGGAWLRTLHQWHWISSALSLVGMLLFAVTGITLNHAGQIESKPVVTSTKVALPAPLQTQLQSLVSGEREPKAGTPLPADVARWLESELPVRLQERDIEWSPDEVYVSLPRPGGDAWLRIDLSGGQVEHEVTDRGWISWLNDLHKGRHTGVLWSWFIDVFALACLVFCISGLLILKHHAAQRPSAWPLVGLGLLLPVLISLLFIH